MRPNTCLIPNVSSLNPLFMRILVLLVFLFSFFSTASAQKVLQIEKYGKAKTKKIYIGEELTYKLYDDDFWYTHVIKDIDVENNLLVFEDRFVNIKNIEKIRWEIRWSKGARSTLYLFGAAWSASALIGTATDGNPDTNYRWSDAIVTGTSWLLGWIVPKIFKYKTYRFGKRKRLRVLDLTFKLGEKKKAKA
jgi:hypothetical protein